MTKDITAFKASRPQSQLVNLDAEQAVLGGLLYENSTLYALGDLGAADFSEPLHAELYAWMQDRIQRTQLCDPITMHEAFVKHEGLKEIGGPAYLADLVTNAGLGSMLPAYGEVIRELSRKRRLYAEAHAIAQRIIASPNASFEEHMGAAERALFSIDAGEDKGDWEDVSVIAEESVVRAQEGEARGIPTGIDDLDDAINGLKRGRLIVGAGRLSMGKTVFGMGIARKVAEQGYGVGVFNFEMDRDEMGLRLTSDLAYAMRPSYSGQKTDPSFLDAMRNKLTQEQWQWMAEGAAKSRGWNFSVNSRRSLTPSQMERAARRLIGRWKRDGVEPGVLIIDHLGKMSPDRSNDNRSAEKADIVDQVTDMAERLDICVLALSQIGRKGDVDIEERPNSSQIEWSDRVGQNAQSVILLYREAYYLERKPRLSDEENDRLQAVRNQMELIIDKARGGKRGTVYCRVNLATASLINAPDLNRRSGK